MTIKPKIEPRRFSVYAGVCLLLLVFGWQLGSTVRQESLTWDEGDHIFDSAVLIDNFQWGTAVVDGPSTGPIM